MAVMLLWTVIKQQEDTTAPVRIDHKEMGERERGKERCYQMWKSDAGIERSEIDFVTTDALLELESVFPFFSVSVENIRDKTVLKQRKRIYKGRG